MFTRICVRTYARYMKVCCDYHLHTFASDGRCSILSHAKKADLLGLEQIAITDHSFSSAIFHLTERKWKKQKEQLARLGCKAKVLHGVESNLVNTSGDIDVPCDVIRDSDVLIVGFHRYIGFCGEHRGGYARKWLFENGFCPKKTRQKLVEVNTRAYLESMDKFPIDVIAHLNHCALVDVKRVCDKAKERDVYIELNEKHLDAIEKYADDLVQSGVNFVLGSDAHDAKKTGKFEKAKAFIKAHGIPIERVFGIDGRTATFKDKTKWRENENDI